MVRKKWPAVYEAYKQRHAKFGLNLGDVIVVGHRCWRTEKNVFRHFSEVDSTVPESVIAVNAMTQVDFGRTNKVYVDYDAIEAAFSRIRLLARDSGLSVNFPLIGCGLANGDWKEASRAIEHGLGSRIEANLWVLPE